MLQIIVSVDCAGKGSIRAVSGCGTTSRSASLIARQPTMLDPSKCRPSSNVSSVSESAGIEKCCQTPGKSMNRKSTVVTSRCRICAKTSFGVTQHLPVDSKQSIESRVSKYARACEESTHRGLNALDLQPIRYCLM